MPSPALRCPNPLGQALLAALLLGVAACRDAVTPTDPDRPAPPQLTLQASTSADEIPDQLAVARAVPGFGGYYIDGGVPTVWLTDPAQRDAAAQALAGFLDSFGWSAADLRVRQASYDYQQLDTWYQQAWAAALAADGAVSSDLDESRNRLRFTGLSGTALNAIAGVLANLGIPTDASVLELSGPVQPVVALTDKVRPPFGGYQIQFFPTPASPLVLVCTLGFNVVAGGVNSFITNSHCSNVQGGITIRTDYYQSTRGGAIPNPDNFIGFEVDDPEYFTGGECPLGRRCRYSDASRAQYGAGQSFQIGRVARTTLLNEALVANDPTYLQVDGANPSYRIIDEQQYPVVGQTLHKVGRTTGWTRGLVEETCVHINITASEITQLCQSLAGAHVGNGDSGSPTFGLFTDGNAFLAGILWGSSTNLTTGAVRFIFSPLGSVRQEMGAFTATDPLTTQGKKPKKAKPR